MKIWWIAIIQTCWRGSTSIETSRSKAALNIQRNYFVRSPPRFTLNLSAFDFFKVHLNKLHKAAVAINYFFLQQTKNCWNDILFFNEWWSVDFMDFPQNKIHTQTNSRPRKVQLDAIIKQKCSFVVQYFCHPQVLQLGKDRDTTFDKCSCKCGINDKLTVY